ncbi:MAG TPA: aldehyde dehydrogenase (NADP(+)) [Candidatus Cybelea sp.]|nr:aldehyde dehydrogenase (NADP(+)) [Candidatus Cybelea sp.]
MAATGKSFIGFREAAQGQITFRAFNPATGQALEPEFQAATVEEVDLAARLASEAFASYRLCSGEKRAEFLNAIADRIEAVREPLVDRAHQETALPKPRLQSEVTRTSGQLRLFAKVAQEGSWVEARIDRADPQRKPLPKPDIRSMLVALGPVAVFSASNFPLAFSVAGGDTASAFAAGNPVIVKAHSNHPGTSRIVGQAVRDSVRACQLHEGVFSLLFGPGTSVGVSLIQHPLIQAGGFTGSTAAGRSLMNLAAARPEPIPFYGELGSTNPVFILPGALRQGGSKIAADLFGSFTLGAGQFCTKPGLVFFPAAEPSSSFLDELKTKVTSAPESALLTKGISSDYDRELGQRRTRADVSVIAEGAPRSANPFAAQTVLYQTEIAPFLASRELSEEHFGPSTLLIRYATKQHILEAARALEGHLTATIHGTEEDLREFAELVSTLQNKVGRIIFNGFPTGVEVCHAMVHGGPYPASTDSRTTSVGSQAIFRFARPVCFQNLPDSALPRELQNANPLGIWRMVDGQLTQQPL